MLKSKFRMSNHRLACNRIMVDNLNLKIPFKDLWKKTINKILQYILIRQIKKNM